METPAERNFTVVQEFSFRETAPTVRAMMDNKGDPWFVGKDVCDILEIANSRDALQKLDEDERDGVALTDATGRNQVQNIVNESGLFNLIFRSDKPQAKAFRKWVTSELLPTLHRVGMYGIPLNMDVPDDPAEALALWVYLDKHQEALQSRLKTVRDLKKQTMHKVKANAQPYHVPLNKQIGLFSGVQS